MDRTFGPFGELLTILGVSVSRHVFYVSVLQTCPEMVTDRCSQLASQRTDGETDRTGCGPTRSPARGSYAPHVRPGSRVLSPCELCQGP